MRTLLKPIDESKPEKLRGFSAVRPRDRRWAKKIRGKPHYFGPWDNPDGALEKYLNERDDLYAGRKPRTSPEGLTVQDLLNRFLTAKTHLLETGEIVQRTFADYKQTCVRIAEVIDKTRLLDDIDSQDFEKLREKIAKKRGPVGVGNEVQRVRVTRSSPLRIHVSTLSGQLPQSRASCGGVSLSFTLGPPVTPTCSRTLNDGRKFGSAW